jgi:hypothetical protein
LKETIELTAEALFLVLAIVILLFIDLISTEYVHGNLIDISAEIKFT